MKTKLWSTDAQIEMDHDIESYTIGNDKAIDSILISHDIKASIAHCDMLYVSGFISKQENKDINQALHTLDLLCQKGEFSIDGFEDCHSAIEAYLVDTVGDAGKKIHTARSRNDQSLTMMRLFMKQSMNSVIEASEELVVVIQNFAKKQKGVAMPGYTHMQKAMPTTVDIWAESFADALGDGIKIAKFTLETIDQNPLGSGAGFGTDLDINRQVTTKKLGFMKTQNNPMYCGLSRGYFEIMCLQSINSIMLIIGKLSADLLLFTTQEFCFFSLPDSYTTGSSIMPHKHNYDVLEIARGKCHMFWTHQQKIQSLVGTIGSGYQRDLQLTKQPFIEALEDAKSTIQIMEKIVNGLEVHKSCLESAITPEMHSVQTINKLVLKGENFRDAYKKVKASM